MKKPLFAFFGTPHFAVLVLNALEKNGYLPALVVCAPDKRQGRGMELKPCPAKSWALARGIDVLSPQTLKDENFVAELGNTDWDVFAVAAYAKLIPKNILNIPRRGALNVHPSLLPKFRGASPIYSAILADARETGVSIMQMNEKMDAGPVVAQAKIEITPEDWPLKGSILLELLGTEGGNLLAEVMPGWIAGTVPAEPQNESEATYTKKFTDQDACIDLSGDARKNLLTIRAFDSKHVDVPQRAHYFDANGKRVIITEAEIEDGALVIKKVIPEGKKEMPYEQFANQK